MPALNIKDDELHAKIKKLAALRGTTSVQIVRDAVEREYQSVQRQKGRGNKSLSERLMQISRQTSQSPTQKRDNRDDILGYDEHGIPSS